jgi:flap endonuclease-1
MGVKIQDLIIRTPLEISQLTGKTMAIDGPNIIFSLFSFSYKNQQFDLTNTITDRTQRVISHLYGLLYRVNFFYHKKILPLFCFDGRVSDLKRMITKDQLQDFRVTRQWYREAMAQGNLEKAREIALGKEFLWPNIIDESKQLLNALGVPYIDSPASAESQCAYLVKSQIVQYANSQDFDSLLFGCPRTIQNLSKALKRKVQGKWIYTKVTPYLVDLHSILQTLQLDQFQLVDLALLIGTDYNSGVKNIGPKTALFLIKKYHSLEKVMRSEKQTYDFSHLTQEIIDRVRKIFLFPDVLETIGSLQWEVPNKGKVIELLCEDHRLNKERVENNLKKVIQNYTACLTYFEDIKVHPQKIQKTLNMTF